MKKVLLLAVAFVAGFTAMAQQNADQLIKVSTVKHDFGKIKQSEPVTTFVEITNISDKPIAMENVWAGCGCTTPEWSREPIAPKGTTKIKIGYNAAAMGTFDKDVNVKIAGAQDIKMIKIVGEVLDAAAYAEYAKNNAASTPVKVAPKTKSAKKTKSTDKK